MTKQGREGFTVAVDTREQHPYRFPSSELCGLKTGDYSIVGLQDRITVERKRREEMFAMAGRERARFERELKRMQSFDYAAIVIEASLPDLLHDSAFSIVSPKAVVASLVSWSVRYGVHVFYAGDRPHGNALTLKILEKFWRHCVCQ